MLQSGTKEMFSNVTQTTKLMSINRVEKDYVGTLVKKQFTTYYQMGDIFTLCMPPKTRC